MKKLRVTVEGKVYEVLVELLDDGRSVAPAPAAVAPAPLLASTAVVSAAPRPAASAAAAPGDVPSPLSGKVVSIDVAVGQTVVEGAQLLTIEAMKMNTYVFAPQAGRIEAVLVKAGDGVNEGAPLVRIA